VSVQVPAVGWAVVNETKSNLYKTEYCISLWSHLPCKINHLDDLDRIPNLANRQGFFRQCTVQPDSQRAGGRSINGSRGGLPVRVVQSNLTPTSVKYVCYTNMFEFSNIWLK
jgi:hypothetical protein